MHASDGIPRVWPCSGRGEAWAKESCLSLVRARGRARMQPESECLRGAAGAVAAVGPGGGGAARVTFGLASSALSAFPLHPALHSVRRHSPELLYSLRLILVCDSRIPHEPQLSSFPFVDFHPSSSPAVRSFLPAPTRASPLASLRLRFSS